MRRLIFFLLTFALAVAAAPPRVQRVDPPNWWRPTTFHSLRLMIQGRHLAGARVTVTPAGFQVRHPHDSANGRYLFVTLTWLGARPPALAHLLLRTSAGSARLDFSFGDRFNWAGGRPGGFGPDDVIYLVMVDRFARSDDGDVHGITHPHRRRAYHGGTLAGIEEHLGYLKKLGVTTLWLTPIVNNKGQQNYHGYAAIDDYRVEEHFGSLTSLRRLIASAHRRGLKVIQDQVTNHTGLNNPWIKDPPTPTWYHGTLASHVNTDFNYDDLVDPYASPAMRHVTLDGWFAGVLADLNQSDPEEARYQIQNSLWWLGAAGFDGIREDTFPLVPCSYWRRWTGALAREFPSTNVVGEVFDGAPVITAHFQRDCATPPADPNLLTVFDYPLYFALRDVFIRQAPFTRIEDILMQDRLYRDPNRLVTFLGNHDVPRFLTEAHGNVADLKLAFAFLLTMRGTPEIYYGDEIGMTGGGDPDNRRDFPRAGFHRATRTAEQQRIFSWVQTLLRIRRDHPALRTGKLGELVVTAQQYVYTRRLGRDAILVAFNNGPAPAAIALPGVSRRGRLLAGHGAWQPGTLHLPGHDVAIFELPAK